MTCALACAEPSAAPPAMTTVRSPSPIPKAALPSVKVGYEISFTRYFYKPHPLRTLEEIRADILALEKETDGLLAEIIGSGA